MQNMLRHAALAFLLLAGMGAAQAQTCVSLTTVDVASSEHFDTLANTGTTNAIAIPGWVLSETGSSARVNQLYAADTGSSNTADTYSYGGAGSVERALGALRSGTLTPLFGACFTNNTGATVNALDIAYTGEHWRLGTADRSDRINFQYSLDASSLATGAWVDVDVLDFATPTVTGAIGLRDGSAAANRGTVAANIGALSIANGATVWIRWTDFDASGADDGLAVDDFQLIARGAGGGQPVLGVSNTSATEGNSGTTPLFFTFSLSQPAGSGGVSIDYATADGTASAGSDYVAATGTVVIPQGESSVTISIDGIGDATPEADETFLLDLVAVTGAAVADPQGVGTIVNDDFTITPIHDIQGAAAASPLAGQVITTTGIVTGRKNNGFFLQASDGEADLDPATSEGVFVFTGGAPTAAVAVGNRVRVGGRVIEFVPPQDPGQAPLTEIGNSPTVALLSTGHALPAPIALDPGFPDPAGALDQLERLEGMRVTAPSLTVVAPTQGNTSEPNATGSSNGILHAVVTGVARPFREPGIQAPDAAPGGGAIPPIPRWDFNPELLTIDSDTLGGPAFVLNLSTGSVIAGLTGPLDFGFRRYTLHRDPAVAIVVTPGMEARPARAPTSDEFTVAAYNLERFFDTLNDAGKDDPVLTATAYQNRLRKASLGIRDALHAPDILATVEVEKLSVLQDIATKVNADAVAAGQPDPQYVAFLEEGNDIGGIDIGFLVKTAAVGSGLARVEIVSVEQVGKDALWMQPDGAGAILNDRPPLLLDAVVHYDDGRAFPITVIAVHQRSLNGADTDDAGGERVRLKRLRQAEFLAELIQQRQAADPGRRIVTLGDFNAFAFNDGLVDAMGVVAGTPTADAQTVVAGDGIDLVDPDQVNLGELQPAAERYSFVFDGNAQTLDHVLVNEELAVATRGSDLDHARINADFPEVARSNPDSPSRLADHDPVIAYFVPRRRADLFATASASNATVDLGQPLVFVASVGNLGPDAAEYPGVGFALDAELSSLVVDAPAGWSCDAPQVAAGTTTVACAATTLARDATADFTLSAATGQAQAGNAVTLGVAVDGQSIDPVTTNNTATAAITVVDHADLSVALGGPVKKLHYGYTGRFPLLLRNAGPDSAREVVVHLQGDAPAANVAIVAPTGWQCTVSGNASTFASDCAYDGLYLAAANQRFDFEIVIPARPDSTGFLTLAASASAATPDPQVGNNTAAYSNRVVGVP